MPWIEGIGDEVTIGVSVLLGLCVLFFAWLSTGIREIPFISVIIVQLTRRATARSDGPDNGTENVDTVNNRNGNETQSVEGSEAIPSTSESRDNANQDNVDDEPLVQVEDIGTTLEPVSDDICSRTETSTVETSPDTGHSEDNVNVSKEDSCEETEPEGCPASNDELRERRLNFFSSVSSGKVPSDNQQTSESDVKCNESDKTNNESKSPSEIKPKSLTKLASDLITATIPTDNSSSDSSVTINSDSNRQQAGSSVDPNKGTDSPPAAGTESEQQSSGLEPGEIRVRIKFFNDTQRSVTALATETIGNFRRRHFSTELSESKLVRFIFNGQDLRNDSSTLQSYNICDNSVLHCLITQPRAEQNVPNHGDDDGLDIGMFMFPLFGLLLGIVWYMRFMYRQLFNVTSTLTLGGITFLYLAAFMSSLRGPRNHEHID